MTHCQLCGASSVMNELRGYDGNMRCFDVYGCRRRIQTQLEQSESVNEADDWYAAECERMKERAPA